MTQAPQWATRAIFALLLLFAVEHARTVLLPITVAIVFTLMLAPVVRHLKRMGLPESLGAALVVLMLLSGVAAMTVAVAGPAVDWWERAPSVMRQLGDTVERLRRAVPLLAPPPAPPQPSTRAARNAPPPQAPADPVKDKIAGESIAFTRVALLELGGFAVSVAAIVVLLYFLLASERWLIARTVQAIPRARARALVLSGVRCAQREISHYFATQFFINCGVGLAVGLSSWWLGLPNPTLWGVATGLLNFIPYLGPVVAGLLMLLASILTFETVGEIVAPVLALTVIHAIESNVVTPYVVGRRLELSPLAVFLSVLLWGWLWGLAGALIAVPMLLVLRIACLRIRRLRWWAAYLERGVEAPSWRTLLRTAADGSRGRARAPRTARAGGE